MLGTTDDHPLRTAYRIVRRLPFVSATWRMLAGGDRWRRIEQYAARGGKFAVGNRTPSPTPIPTFGSEEYFRVLINLITASRPAVEPEPGRVVLVNNGLSAGGAERQIVYTLQGLKARGYDVRFIGEFLHRAPGLDFHAPALASAGIPIEPFHRRASPGPDLYSGVSRAVAEALAAAPIDFMLDILDMAAVLSGLRPQVVHLWQDQTSTKHAFAALIAGVPRIVLSGRNLNPTHFTFHEDYMRGAYRALSTTPGVRFTNNTHAGALSYTSWLELAPGTIGVIRNGFACPTIAPAEEGTRAAARSRFGIASAERLVLGVFRLSPEKRPHLWVDAAAIALNRRADLIFLLAGTGPLEAELRSRVNSAGLADRVRLIGEMADVSSLYAAADLFFLASSEEGAPNVLIEAQWAGLASVVTDAGGVTDTVQDGETALVVRDATAANLAEAILATLDNSSLIESARERGPERVVAIFGVERMIEDTLGAYRIST